MQYRQILIASIALSCGPLTAQAQVPARVSEGANLIETDLAFEPAPEVPLPTLDQIVQSSNPLGLISVDQIPAWYQDPRAIAYDPVGDSAFSIFSPVLALDGMRGLKMTVELPNIQTQQDVDKTKKDPTQHTYFKIGYEFTISPDQNGNKGKLKISRRLDGTDQTTLITDPVEMLAIAQPILRFEYEVAYAMRGKPVANAPLTPAETFLHIFIRAAEFQTQAIDPTMGQELYGKRSGELILKGTLKPLTSESDRDPALLTRTPEKKSQQEQRYLEQLRALREGRMH